MINRAWQAGGKPLSYAADWPQMAMTPLKLLLVDDHAIFREGLRLLLADISASVEIEDVGTLAEAVKACARTTFRMVLLDLGLSASSGLATLQRFREAVPDVPVIVLSGDQDPDLIRQSLDIGALGFIPKAYNADLMIAALRHVLGGGIYLPARVLSVVRSTALREHDAPSVFSELSERQQDVLHLMLQGMSNKLIGQRLGISEKTVKVHVSAILQTLRVRNRVEAIMLAAKLRLKIM